MTIVRNEIRENGVLIRVDEYDDGLSDTPDLSSAIAEIRSQAARLSPTGATAIALNATADALEALVNT